MPKISFAVPVYNAEKSLYVCVQSILSQTFSDIELVLVNDGSTDNSAKICDDFSKKDSRVKVIHKQNGGAASARNAALDVITGEYVFFCDADDFIEPTACEVLYKKAKSQSFDIVVFGYRADYVNENYSVNYIPEEKEATAFSDMAGVVFYLLSCGMFESSCNKLFKTELIQRTGARFPLFSVSEDAMFNTELFMNTESAACVSDVLYHYVKIDKVSLTNSYHSTLSEIINVRSKQYKKLLNHFSLCDGAAKKWYAGRIVRDGMLSLINMFKKGCPFSFSEKITNISELISGENFKNSLKISSPHDMNEKIFYLGLSLKHPALITAFFTFVFAFKNIFDGLYKTIRKKSNKKAQSKNKLL